MKLKVIWNAVGIGSIFQDHIVTLLTLSLLLLTLYTALNFITCGLIDWVEVR